MYINITQSIAFISAFKPQVTYLQCKNLISRSYFKILSTAKFVKKSNCKIWVAKFIFLFSHRWRFYSYFLLVIHQIKKKKYITTQFLDMKSTIMNFRNKLIGRRKGSSYIRFIAHPINYDCDIALKTVTQLRCVTRHATALCVSCTITRCMILYYVRTRLMTIRCAWVRLHAVRQPRLKLYCVCSDCHTLSNIYIYLLRSKPFYTLAFLLSV